MSCTLLPFSGFLMAEALSSIRCRSFLFLSRRTLKLPHMLSVGGTGLFLTHSPLANSKKFCDAFTVGVCALFLQEPSRIMHESDRTEAAINLIFFFLILNLIVLKMYKE